MALNTENFFEEWRQKKLPEEWQKKTDGFANAPIDNSVEQSIFRAGFFIGINLEEIKKEYGIEDEGVKSKKFFFKKKRIRRSSGGKTRQFRHPGRSSSKK